MYTLTVNYVDEEGNLLADSYEEELQHGYVYEIKSPEITGYSTETTSVTGKLLSDTTVDVVYAADEYEVRYYINSVLTYTDAFRYGETVEKRPDEVQDGWVFSGWSEIPDIMPAEDVEVFATLTIDVYYKIMTYRNEITVSKGEKIRSVAALKIIGDVVPESGKLVWKSDNEEIAKVKNGEIAGVGLGECTIRISMEEDETVYAEIAVTVTEKAEDAGILINGEDVSGETVVLEREDGNPEFTVITVPEGADANYKFTTTNKNIAYVKDGVLILHGKTGRVVITAEAADGSGKTVKVTLDVK